MRGNYNTRQKRELLTFLKSNNLKNYSLDDVVFELQGQGKPIGRSTVYRYLEALAEQGVVRKYQSAQGITQYQHIEDDADCAGHFHMLCKRCGKLLHVDCDLMERLAAHIQQDHGFILDPRETVLVGVCGKCAQKAREGEQNGADNA